MRQDISTEKIELALSQIRHHTGLELYRKGSGTFVSSHEILGTVTEEYFEVVEAVRSNSQKHFKLKEELLDLATACQFAIACIDSDIVE